MKLRNIVCFILFVLLAFLSYYLFTNDFYSYLIIVGPVDLIALFFTFKGLGGSKTPEDEYNSFLREIMKTYDAVLIDVVEMPNVDGRSIIKVTNFEDLIDAQIEIRKPIYFKRDDRSSLFVLLDDKQVCIFILKVDDKEESRFDKWVAEQEKEKVKFDESLLSDIENTTIVKLDNNKSYRISPIREKGKNVIKNYKELEKTLSGLPKLKDTTELSRTQMFKSLNKRNKKN